MNLDTNVLVTAISTVAAGAFSGFFAYLATRNYERTMALKDRTRELRAAQMQALHQIEAYHTLEGVYAAELEFAGVGKVIPLKTEFRNRVETLGFDRPTMTAHEAREAINALHATVP